MKRTPYHNPFRILQSPRLSSPYTSRFGTSFHSLSTSWVLQCCKDLVRVRHFQQGDFEKPKTKLKQHTSHTVSSQPSSTLKTGGNMKLIIACKPRSLNPQLKSGWANLLASHSTDYRHLHLRLFHIRYPKNRRNCNMENKYRQLATWQRTSELHR